MERPANDHRRLNTTRAMIQVVLLVFLSYSVQLMGEFTAAGEHKKSIGSALYDISTVPNFLIAVIAALIGCAVIEYLRETAI